MTEKNRNKLLREKFKDETNPQVLERMESLIQKYESWPEEAVLDLNRYLLIAKMLISSRESLINSSLAKELDKLFFYSVELSRDLGYEDEKD